jgi:hypothetical protein
MKGITELDTVTYVLIFAYFLATVMVYIGYGIAVFNHSNPDVNNDTMKVLFFLSLIPFVLSMSAMNFSPFIGAILLAISLIFDYSIGNIIADANSKTTKYDVSLAYNSYAPYVAKMILVLTAFYYYGNDSGYINGHTEGYVGSFNDTKQNSTFGYTPCTKNERNDLCKPLEEKIEENSGYFANIGKMSRNTPQHTQLQYVKNTPTELPLPPESV